MRLSLVSLSVLAAALASTAVFAQENGHGDHSHQHDDHGHDHGHDDHGHDHGGNDHDEDHHSSGLRLNVETGGDLAAGEAAILTLQLTGPDGEPVAGSDFTESHERLVHVLIVDESLEDYHHLHIEPDSNGEASLSFTPAHSRIYRVWVDGRLAEPFEVDREAHDHHDGHDDHGHDHDSQDGDDHAHDHGAHAEQEGHGDHGGDHHAAHADGAVKATDWVRVGDEAAPYIIPVNVLTADTAGLSFTLTPEGEVDAGHPVRMSLNVSGAEGALEPYLGAFAHVVGFNTGASQMAHAHPLGEEPSSADDRAGPDLAFEVSFETAGVHRLFVEVRHDGDIVRAPFTVVVAE